MFLLSLILGFLLPQELKMPVEGADKNSYHAESFWYYPWGESVTTKGWIFSPKSKLLFFRRRKGWLFSQANFVRGET